MYSFTPTEEQQMLIEAVHRYAEADIRKVAHDCDESGDIPDSLVSKGWELGILPGLIPEEYGGYADDQAAVTGVLALEEMAWGDLSVAMKVWAPSTFALAVLHAGTEDQKQSLLPLFCDMDRPVMTAAMVEPEITFDVWKPKTTATRENGSITLSGRKCNVPLAGEASKFIVYAADSETGKVDGYMVDASADGLEIGDREKLMGIRGLPTYTLSLTGVTIPASDRLGGDDGTNYAAILDRSRIAHGALLVGVSRSSFEYARDYAKDRVQFGVPIATKQAIAFKLADMAIEVDAARLVVWEAAWKADRGQDLTRAAAVLRHHSNKTSMFVTDNGVQILGGYGYIREYPAERYLRNARGFASFEGLAIV